MDSQTTYSIRNNIIRILETVFLGIVVSVVSLFIEYKTGIFIPGKDPKDNFGGIFFVISQFILFISIMNLVFIWIRPEKSTREDFAFAYILFFFLLTTALISSFSIGLFPWHIITIFVDIIQNKQVGLEPPSWAEYILIVIAYILVLNRVFYIYSKWHGLKSVEQYKKEQNGQIPSFQTLFIEGIQEAARRIKKESPLQLYSNENNKGYVAQLENVSDSLAWKDQAKELIRLSSSVYEFKPDDWHDKPGCWLGKNIKTGETICIYPIQLLNDDLNFVKLFEYLDKLQKQSKRYKLGEIIVAVKEDTPWNTNDWHGQTIRFETESSLLDNLVDFRDYENDIRKRVLLNRLADSELSINDVYVQSTVTHVQTNTLYDNLENYLSEWLNEPGQRQLALLGEYGQGKSTATLMFTYHLLSNKKQTKKRFPIIIELRGRSPRHQTRLGLLGDWASKYRIDPQSLERLLDAGRLLIIFEGFDEMSLVGDSEMRLAHFKTLWNFCYPKSKILITGRPNFFLDEEEMRKALGINEANNGQPYSDVIRLQPFGISQIKRSLRKQKKSVKNQICNLAQSNSRFLELVSRPSLLHIVAELWEKENLSENVDKLNSAYVMDLFIRHSYRRQGLKESDAPGFMALNTPEREYFMSGIATFMAAKRLPNQITSKQLNEAIDALLRSIPDQVSAEPSTISGEVNNPLKIRVAESEYGIEHIKTDVRACGILVDDPSSLGTFRFGHKSFMEFLFADVVAEHITNKESTKANSILSATEAGISDILALPVSVEFLSELINNNISKEAGWRESHQRIKFESAFAKDLFNSIVGRGKLSQIIQRFQIFDTAYTRSCRKFANKLARFSLLLFAPYNFFFLIMFLSSILVLFSDKQPSSKTLQLNDPQSILILLITALLTIIASSIFMMLYTSKIFGLRRLLNASNSDAMSFTEFELWNYICHQVGISDIALHTFVGTRIIPWAKSKPFDYFLRKDEELKKE